MALVDHDTRQESGDFYIPTFFIFLLKPISGPVIFVTYNFDRKVASTQDINYKTKYFFVYIPKAAVENLFQAATKVHL
ncbi:hypothetical protein HMPREF2533_00033 [Bacteroides fragilis]|uniref:Uncharacterized protein n=1 Tax=Bacteroides fragilis (strain ATCC 25285 / DSM 2151 / CCUG 4856 / JCM 11019 / LMG 10263 / NCTC 9343 / Onslow / VPI 2553 / EN-2) TaxID=272559 RepID=Q5LH09_BACFN|nr:hypothetical protein HMPREF2530_00033 [Bacteroides fragilis]CAH06577.1 hypothetical protein BF9343_0796 [Bacteroides fragilis NCTC 9343]KXU51516.1 hypothetical protein HMPREF2533_00033 [Bacteroides fragilis]OCJ76100.1 hypothetical protein BCV58_13295 [Bacteroides fragilis]OOD26097.1 hypothetical protein BWP07_10215 [Bacteroides fragilis]